MNASEIARALGRRGGRARAQLLLQLQIVQIERLAVGEVIITSAGSDEPVAHVTATYSIPQR